MTNGLALQRIKEYYGKKSSWPDVGRAVAQDALKNGQIHAVTERDVNRYQALSHALYHGRVKHSPTLRRALGLLPKTVPVEPCADCGEVHTRLKQCSDERQTRTRHRVALEVDTPDEAAALRAILARYGTRREVAAALVRGELRIVEGE